MFINTPWGVEYLDNLLLYCIFLLTVIVADKRTTKYEYHILKPIQKLLAR